MRLKRCILPVVGCIFLCGPAIEYSQVGPAARSSNLPLVVGVGFSNFDSEWAAYRVSGGAVSIDYYPAIIPHFLNGLGLEIEARDLSYNKPPQLQGWKQDTAGGGAIYSLHHFRSFRPYAKGLIEYGSFDFNLGSCCADYKHDTRTLYAIGGGLDYHVFRHIWARGEYEFQSWQPLFGDPHYLTPNGFTIGAVYDFRPAQAR